MDLKNSGISPRRRMRQRGATLVMFTMVTACVVIPMVGLAIDGSIAFWAKAKLSAAVDAAVLAAGRNVNGKLSQATNTNNSQIVVSQWINANFPNGWLGSTLTVQPVTYNLDAKTSAQQVVVSASAKVPMYFMRLVGQNSITVSAMAQSSRRQSYVILILDRSLSMMTAANSTQTACDVMKADAIQFTSLFTEGFDTVGLITFSSTVKPDPNIDFSPSQTFRTGMTAAISSIQCNGFTSTAQALSVAYNVLKTANLQNGLSAIVLFTDGQPDELVADFPVRTAAEITTDTDQRHAYQSPYAFTSYPASGCSVSTIRGGLQSPVVNAAPLATGDTWGLYDITNQVNVLDSAGYVKSTGCAFSGTWYPTNVRKDIAGIPSFDIYGNGTGTGYAKNPGKPYYGTLNGTAVTVDKFSNGLVRDDEQLRGVNAAAINTADYAAQRIRYDLGAVIYTIGLGGDAAEPIDDMFLTRIANANVPSNLIYDSSIKTGNYYRAASASQLSAAFSQVASQILRLSQ